MAYITKRGSSYSVRYTYQDEHGKSCEDVYKRQTQGSGHKDGAAGGFGLGVLQDEGGLAAVSYTHLS